MTTNDSDGTRRWRVRSHLGSAMAPVHINRLTAHAPCRPPHPPNHLHTETTRRCANSDARAPNGPALLTASPFPTFPPPTPSYRGVPSSLNPMQSVVRRGASFSVREPLCALRRRPRPAPGPTMARMTLAMIVNRSPRVHASQSRVS